VPEQTAPEQAVLDSQGSIRSTGEPERP